MRDDIPALLRDAAADPTHTPDFDALAARGRRQHLAGRVATAALAVVALVAGGVVLWPAADPADRIPAIDDAPTGSEQPSPAPVLPAGWHEIQVGDAVLGVPGDWTVETLAEPTSICPNTADRPTAYVHLGGLADERVCQLPATFALTVEVAPLADVPDRFLEAEEGRSWQPVTTARAVPGERLDRNDHGTVVSYRFPQLGLWVQFADGDPVGARADPILDTVARVLEPVPVARGDLPTGWQPVEAGDASFGVPGLWHIERVGLMETMCPDVLDAPTVLIFDPERPNVRPDGCNLTAGTRPTLTTGSLHAWNTIGDRRTFRDGDAVTVNGHTGEKYVSTDEGGRESISFEFDSLDLFLWFRRADLAPSLPAQVVATLASTRAAAPSAPTTTTDSTPKVAVIVADSAVVDEQLTVENGWGIETFATCDPAEYAPATDDEVGQTVWTDREGSRVPTSTITSFPGPAHCGWQSVTFLHLDDRQYLRDPQDLLRDQTTTPYDDDSQLPDNATDTGYHNDGQELWLAPDADIAFIVTNTTVEAWPATTTRVACA